MDGEEQARKVSCRVIGRAYGDQIQHVVRRAHAVGAEGSPWACSTGSNHTEREEGVVETVLHTVVLFGASGVAVSP